MCTIQILNDNKLRNTITQLYTAEYVLFTVCSMHISTILKCYHNLTRLVITPV